VRFLCLFAWILENTIEIGYYLNMIMSFADEEMKLVSQGERSRKLPNDIQPVAFRKLGYIQAATLISDLRQPPSHRLEKLTGDRAGDWSIRVNDKWQICFKWVERQPNPDIQAPQPGDAYDVEIDNHYA
jgi:toxin HigB-1